MDDTTLQAKRSFSRIGFSLFTIAFVASFLQIVLSVLWILFGFDNGNWGMWFITFAPLYLAAVPLGLLIMRKVPREDHPAVKLSNREFLYMMLICMPIMYGGNLIGIILSSLLSGGTAQNPLLSYITDNPLYAAIFTVILAPVIEEYVFRKQIIDRLGRYGELTAIVFSALTFGLFHMNLFQFFYAFGLGLIFAYVYTLTRMLRYTVLMHMIINFLGSVLAPGLVNGLDPDLLATLEAGEATMEQIMPALPGLATYAVYLLFLLISVIAGFVLLFRNWGKQFLLPASSELPKQTVLKTAYFNWGMILFTVFCLLMIGISLFSGLV